MWLLHENKSTTQRVKVPNRKVVIMDYKITETTIGPVITWGEELITLQDVPTLLDIAYTHPSFLKDLHDAIQRGMESAFSDQVEAFKMNMNFHSPKANAYTASANQYIAFIAGPWPQYRKVMDSQ